MAHKKAGGSSRNGRDSAGRRLGVKKFAGQSVIAGVTATKTSTSIASIDTFSASTYRSANYQIQVVRGTNYNMTTINIIHDGTNTYMTEYGSINQPVGIATFGSDINSGNVRLLATPTSSDSTVFKITRTVTKA